MVFSSKMPVIKQEGSFLFKTRLIVSLKEEQHAVYCINSYRYFCVSTITAVIKDDKPVIVEIYIPSSFINKISYKDTVVNSDIKK